METINHDCLFCKIITNEIKCNKIYENNSVLAFLDISPLSRGHTLVIPKIHYDTYLDMSEQDYTTYFKFVNIISKLLKNKLDCDGLFLFINIGKDTGQEIMHQHVHLIPRWKNDNSFIFNQKKSNINTDENYFKTLKSLLC